MFSWSKFQRKRCRQWYLNPVSKLPPPLRPHDPTNVFHKVNIKSFFTNHQINFCNFYVNIWSPGSSNTSIHQFFNLPNFGYCDWLINQNAAYVIRRSRAAETNSSYSFRFSLCWTSIPCSSRHLVNFLPPSIKDLDRRFQNDLHLYPLLQRVWFQQAMVLHAPSIYMPWWVQIFCWTWKIFSKWEILNFVWNQVLGNSFSLNPEWNHQKENGYLLTIVLVFHAIIGEAQSSVFYVTHALHIKVWTNSIFYVFWSNVIWRSREINFILF